MGPSLEPSARSSLEDEARDIEAIADVIVAGEFGAAGLSDTDTRSWLTSLIDDWLFDPSGRGAASVLRY